METAKKSFAQNSLNIKSNIDAILHSKCFFALCAALVILFHTLNLTTVGYGVMLAVILYCVITQKDLLPVVTILGLIFFVMSTDFVGDIENPHDVDIKDYIPFAVVFGTLVIANIIATIVRVVKNRSQNLSTSDMTQNLNVTSNIQKLKMSSMLIPTLVFSGAILLGGIFSPYYTQWLNIGIIVLLVAMYLGLMIFSNNCSSRLNTDYILKLVFTIGMVVCIQVLLYYATHIKDIYNVFKYRQIHLGWGWSNFAGLLIAMSIPSAFYMAFKYDGIKKYAFIALAVVMYAILVSTMSRNSILFGALVLAAMCIYTFFKSSSQEKLYLIGTGLLAILVVGIFAFIFRNQTKIVFDNLYNLGFDDSERFDWYKLGLDAFSKFPIFGVGWQYDVSKFINNQPFFAVHNSPIQYLASVGIIGTLGVGYLFFKRIQLLYKSRKQSTFFVGAVFFIIVATGLLDLSVLNPIYIFISALIFAALEANRDNSKFKIQN